MPGKRSDEAVVFTVSGYESTKEHLEVIQSHMQARNPDVRISRSQAVRKALEMAVSSLSNTPANTPSTLVSEQPDAA